MFSLQLFALVLPALVLASSDDWLLSLLEKRDGVDISHADELSSDLRMVAKQTRPPFRRFLRSLNFACRKLNALNSTSNERIKALFDFNNEFGNSLRNSCALYFGVRRQYLGAAARFSLGFSLVCRRHKAVRTSNGEDFPLLRSILSEHRDFNSSLHESCEEFRKVRMQIVKTIGLLRNRNRPSPTTPEFTSPTAASGFTSPTASAGPTSPTAASGLAFPTAASGPTVSPFSNSSEPLKRRNDIKRLLRELFERL